MDHYLIVARSVTHAQQMENTLTRAGVPTKLFRAPNGLLGQGCSYVLQLAPEDLGAALTVLHGARMDPVSIFLSQSGVYREVGG